MVKHILAVAGCVGIFAGERYAEVIWPSVPPNVWLGIALTSGAVMLAAIYWERVWPGFWVSKKSRLAEPVDYDWEEFETIPLKYAACLWVGLPPGTESLKTGEAQAELARLTLAAKQRKLEHPNGDFYHGMLKLFGGEPGENDEFSKEAYRRYAVDSHRPIPPFLKEEA